MGAIRILLLLHLALLAAALVTVPVSARDTPDAGAEQGRGAVIVLSVDGAIGPATDDYLRRGLARAAERRAGLVVLMIDTPGGLDTSMRSIIQAILASPVPVAGFVHPGGARAASAGTYILYASHIAAMAPATNLGAATPVRISGLPGGEPGGESGGEPGAEGAPPGEGGGAAPQGAMERKIVNDAVAYIQGLARMRGRNAGWAERAVREGVSLAAHEALVEGVIDLVVEDLQGLLVALDGRTVEVLGDVRELATQGVPVVHLEPDWRTRLLAIITDPNVAYILMLIGIYGLIYELASPGMIFPGVVGAISLLLALFAFQVLPINLTGLVLMVLGIVFMIAEFLVPAFGILGIGGVIAFVVGSILLLDTGIPGYGVSLPLIATFAAFSAFFFIFVIGMVFKARRRPVVSGREELVGAPGEAIDDFGGEDGGRVRVLGEVWSARSDGAVPRGARVRVRAVDGLVLIVGPDPGPQTEEEG